MLSPGPHPQARCIQGFRHRHPHTLGVWHANNTIYLGEGGVARRATDSLRLTVKGHSPRNRRIPSWLEKTGLTYHADQRRWTQRGRLIAASRGQEFVTCIDGLPAARRWLENTLDEIERQKGV